MAFNVVLLGLKVPAPPVHIPVVEPPVTLPDRLMSGLLAQTVSSGPASTIGPGTIVITIVSDSGRQFPFPVDVSIRVTYPARISAFDGVYTALSVVLFGLYVPVPPDQIPPVAFNTVPFN